MVLFQETLCPHTGELPPHHTTEAIGKDGLRSPFFVLAICALVLGYSLFRIIRWFARRTPDQTRPDFFPYEVIIAVGMLVCYYSFGC